MAASKCVDSNPTLPRKGGVPVSSPPQGLAPAPPQEPAPAPAWNYQDFEKLTAYMADEHPISVVKDASLAEVVSTRFPELSYEQSTVRAADGVGRAPSHDATDGEVARSMDPAIAVKERFRQKKWTLFFGGNLISAAVVISELSRTLTFFHEFLQESNSVAKQEVGWTQSECFDRATTVRFFVVFALVIGLFADLVAAVGLPLVYRSPLDIKSAHKIPHGDMRSCVASMMVNVFAPLSWGIIYTCGGIVGHGLARHSPCMGDGGSALKIYLFFSSVYMVLVGLKMLGVSMAMVFFSCGSPAKCTDRCCASIGKTFAHRILSVAAFLDLFWQLQGAIWLYRIGADGLASLFALLFFGVAGGVLAALGSLAPEMVEELEGPLPLVVLSRPPEPAKGP